MLTDSATFNVSESVSIGTTYSSLQVKQQAIGYNCRHGLRKRTDRLNPLFRPRSIYLHSDKLTPCLVHTPVLPLSPISSFTKSKSLLLAHRPRPSPLSHH